jgi:hypothetical protein
MPRRRPLADVERVLELKRTGLTDREISEITGVPINTIRSWRNRRVPRHADRVLHAERFCSTCGLERHRFCDLDPETYSYLLGVYLGDGTVARNRTSWTLRVALDNAYPGIIRSSADAVGAVRGVPAIVRPHHSGAHCSIVESTWKAWPCYLPQHGPGRKHCRRIELVPWQLEIVDAAPGAFLRGLIHTDGWRGENRVVSKGKRYSYPRYQFSNRSDDIRELFTAVCDKLGVKWRRWTRYHISVAQRDSVAVLDALIGPKY